MRRGGWRASCSTPSPPPPPPPPAPLSPRLQGTIYRLRLASPAPRPELICTGHSATVTGVAFALGVPNRFASCSPGDGPWDGKEGWAERTGLRLVLARRGGSGVRCSLAPGCVGPWGRQPSRRRWRRDATGGCAGMRMGDGVGGGLIDRRERPHLGLANIHLHGALHRRSCTSHLPCVGRRLRGQPRAQPPPPPFPSCPPSHTTFCCASPHRCVCINAATENSSLRRLIISERRAPQGETRVVRGSLSSQHGGGSRARNGRRGREKWGRRWREGGRGKGLGEGSGATTSESAIVHSGRPTSSPRAHTPRCAMDSRAGQYWDVKSLAKRKTG